MAKLEINLPDAVETRLIAGFCQAHGYRATIENIANGAMIANPENKRQFAKRIMAEWFKSQAISGEVSAATEAAQKAVSADASLVVT